MPPFGFCSGFYTAQSVSADAQTCLNFYPERNESGAGKSQMQLYPTPGTRKFARLYDDIVGLSIVPLTTEITFTPFTLTEGTYYAAIALLDGTGKAVLRSYVFGPFPVKVTRAAPPQALITASTFLATVPYPAPAGGSWVIYFGTSRTNLNQKLVLGSLVTSVTANGAAAVLPDVAMSNSVPVQKELNGRLFVVTDTAFWEVFEDGFAKFIGTIAGDHMAKSMDASNLELLTASGGKVYLYNLADATLQEIDTLTLAKLQGPVSIVAFSDGYFFALLRDSQKFQISGIFDGSAWDPADLTKVSVTADNILGMTVDHREVFLLGRKQSIGYYDSGNPFFPFDVIPGAFIEQGISAPDSLTKLDNSTFWIGADERGDGIAWRLQGYNTQRISTHAIENAWAAYSRIDDANGWSYQDHGHTFWVIYFPTPGKTWVYDVATQLWHERSGALISHSFAFGKHLVGDAKLGILYEMSIDFLDNDGTPLRRVRRAPHISAENNWIFHHELRIDMEVGLAPQIPLKDGRGEPRDPQVMVRWSDDGGHTWSNEHTMDCGKAGEFKQRVLLRRLGRSRSRVYELAAADPVPYRIIEAYLNS